MNDAQHKLYISIWSSLRKRLRAQGGEPIVADRMRHELIREALGYDKSSKDFTNAEFDLVKKEMLALLAPSMLGPQLEDHDRRRHLWKLDKLLEQLQRPRSYAEAIATRMAREGKISGDDLERMPLDELRKIISALNYQAGNAKRKSAQMTLQLSETRRAAP